jgi:hypothetical protein
MLACAAGEFDDTLGLKISPLKIPVLGTQKVKFPNFCPAFENTSAPKEL